jgi:hypothetical protein
MRSKTLLCVVTIVSCTCFWLILIALLLQAFLWYEAELDSLVKDECIVTDCDVYERTCSTETCYDSTTSTICYTDTYTCWQVGVEFYLTLNSKNYTASNALTYNSENSADGFCNDYQYGSNITCWYKPGNIQKTLTIEKTDAVQGPITSITVLAIVGFFIFIICSFSFIWYFGCYRLDKKLKFWIKDFWSFLKYNFGKLSKMFTIKKEKKKDQELSEV